MYFQLASSLRHIQVQLDSAEYYSLIYGLTFLFWLYRVTADLGYN